MVLHMNFSRRRPTSMSFALSLVAITAATAVATPARAEESAPPPLAPTATPMSEAAAPTHPRDVGMRTAGQVLVTVGLTSVATGTAVILGFALQERCDFCGIAGLAYGGPVVGLGLILTAIGAPLWAVGGAEIPHEGPRAGRVDLHIGAGSVSVSGSF